MRYHAVVFMCCAFCGVPCALGADYFVATDGNDDNPGTESLPWRTVQKAADTIVAGDTVYIKEGTYVERVTPQHSGSPGQYVTYRGYPGHQVIIQSPNEWQDDFGILLYDADLHYLRFADLTLEGANAANFYANPQPSGSIGHIMLENIRSESSYHGIALYQGVTDSEIRGCEVHYNQYGIFLWDSNRNIVIDNNHVSHGQIVRPDYSDRSHCIDVSGGWVGNENSNITISNNHVHNSMIQGIVVWESNQVLVKGNYSHDNGATGIQIETSDEPSYRCVDIIVEDNVCAYNSQVYPSETGIWIDDADQVIVQRNTLHHNEVGLKITGSVQVIARHNVIYDNYHNYYGNAAGIFVSASIAWGGGDDILVHNTCFRNGEGSQRAQILIGKFATEPEVLRAVFKNNIASESRASVYDLDLWVQGLTHTLDYNSYYNSLRDLGVVWQETIMGWPDYLATSAQDGHSITADPRMIDPNAADFELSTNSPCIDAGGFLTTTTDSGSGMVLQVEDARYFSDGMGIVDGDRIQIGANEAATVLGVDYEANTITVDRSLEWEAGDGVSYPYEGSAPDMGAFESPPASDPIPTVSEWGMVVMTLLTMTAVTLVLRRRVELPAGPERREVSLMEGAR